jgi:hypothetical protein
MNGRENMATDYPDERRRMFAENAGTNILDYMIY